MKTAIVGGGAAGFFCAIQLATMCPDMEITIFEQQKKVLSKVEISGGGRCNCTNSFRDVSDLGQVYPRGAKLLKRLFKQFGPRDAFQWFEDHGVPLVTQEDQCVFPQAQDSHAIIDCFMEETRRLGVKIKLDNKIESPEVLFDGGYDYVVMTVGGTPGKEGCVPSLFTFNINDRALTSLMGVVVENAIASIPGTKYKTQDALLITHWGVSGPAILKLSSHAARHLAEHSYKSPMLINWTGETNAETVREAVADMLAHSQQKQIDNVRPYNLQNRLWEYLLTKTSLKGKRCGEIGSKGINRLVDTLTNDTYLIVGRNHYKEEFVTCGGVPLDSVDKSTLESKERPNLYYAGEVLDIDGVTGGFNFQAAWTTAYAVAKGISEKTK